MKYFEKYIGVKTQIANKKNDHHKDLNIQVEYLLTTISIKETLF